MTRLRKWLGMALLLAAAATAGCFQSRESTWGVRYGVTVPDEAVAAIRPGETTREWVIALFGPPSLSEQLPDGREKLSYDFQSRRTSNKRIALLVNTESTTMRGSRVHFELQNGVVSRCWTEELF